MAAANDSQGLKIAVAVFVTLTVILGVTTYFGFSNASEAEAKFTKAESEKSNAVQEAVKAKNDLTDLKQLAGFEKIEDYPAVKEAITKDAKRLDGLAAEIRTKVEALTAAYKQAGGNDAKIEELRGVATQIATQFTGEPNRTFQSSLNRLMELATNQAELSTALQIDNQKLRTDLERANQVAQAKIDVEAKNFADKSKDLNDEHDKHETERSGLLTRLDQLQSLNQQYATKIQGLENDLAQVRTNSERTIGDMARVMKGIRDQSERSATVMDRPSGKIVFVDSTRNEVRTDLNRRKGAHPQLVFAVFDRNSPGVPTDKPKATIELVEVNDRDSVARIVKTVRSIDPIRNGDYIYSPVFSPEKPLTVALIGRIDLNRDGVDDRNDLKRIITQFGGQVVYDLPPPYAGSESGKVSPLIDWYVTDERAPIRSPNAPLSGNQPEDVAFDSRKAEVTKQLRDTGVRPTSVERLLGFFNYSHDAIVSGRVEAINRSMSRDLLDPKGQSLPTPPTSPPAAPAGNNP